MKRDPISSSILAALLAALSVIAAVFCFVSAFELPLGAAAGVVPAIALTALGGALVARVRKGWLWLLIGSVVFGGGAAFLGGIKAGAVVIDHVSMLYEQIYGWQSTMLSVHFPTIPTGDMALVTIGGLLSAWVAFLMARRVPPVIPLVLSVLPFVPCFVVTNTVPKVGWVFLLVFTLLTYLLSASGNGKKPLTFGRVAVTAAAVLAVTAVLFVLLQPDAEYNKADERRDRLLAYLGFGTANGVTDHTAYEDNMAMRFNDITAFDGNGDEMVAKIYSEREEFLYLREQDYALYQYGSWLSQEGNPERFQTPTGVDKYLLMIETPIPFSKKFVPYGVSAGGNPHLENGNLQNIGVETVYDWWLGGEDEFWRASVAVRADHYSKNYLMYAYQGREVYLTLPMATKLWAQEKLDSAILSGNEVTNTEKADKVAAFVRNSAAYVRTSNNEGWENMDFAEWFIETQDEGNCVHFATSAAVLLRAANVPTRFVTGYLTEAKTKQWVAVTERDAHAWVEYYEPAIGCWIKLEATPVGAFSPNAEETTTQPAQATTATTPTTTAAAPVTTSPTQLPVLAPEEEQSNTVWFVLSGVIAVCAIVYAQRVVRLRVRKKRQMCGAPNTRAHEYWRDIARLSKVLHEAPPSEAKRLAEKAKFSQHTLSGEELDILVAILCELTVRVKAKPWYQQPWYCLVLALY